MTITAVRTDLHAEVEPKPFAAACAWVAKHIPRAPAVPTLGGMLLDVHDGQLAVSGFDHNTANKAVVEASGDGSALVSARLLSELVKTFPAKPIRFTDTGKVVTVTCGAVKVTLPKMPIDEYPALPVQPTTVGTVDAGVLANALRRVGVAADPNCAAGVPSLSGIHFTFTGDRIQVMASDRYRGALAEIDWQPTDPGFTGAALVPASVLADVGRSWDGADAITVSLDEGLFGLATDTHEVVTRLVAEKFPVHMVGLFPARAGSPAIVPVAELSTALRRADLVRAPKTAARFDFSAGLVVVSATGLDGESATTEEVTCGYNGPAATLHANPLYVIDALSAVGGDTVEVTFTTPTKPILFTHADDADYRHLVVPISPR